MEQTFGENEMNQILVESQQAFHSPDQVLQYMNLGQCTVMADIGCGPGWFTIEAAKKMMPGGLVYGIDLNQEVLTRIQQRAQEEGVTNLHTVLANESDEWPIPTESVDVALVADVFHLADSASNFIGEVKRILKPASTCLVVEWKTEEGPIGPPLNERVDQQDVTEEFYASGFVLAGTCDVGPYHYGLKFYKIKEAQEPHDTLNNVVP